MEDKKIVTPVQPYLTLDAEDYQELLNRRMGISSFYEFNVKNGNSGNFRAVPDGSTDLVFGIGERENTRNHQPAIGLFFPRMFFRITVKFGRCNGAKRKIFIAHFEWLFCKLKHSHKVIIALRASATSVASRTGKTLIRACTAPTLFRIDGIIIIVGLDAARQPRCYFGAKNNVAQ